MPALELKLDFSGDFDVFVVRSVSLICCCIGVVEEIMTFHRSWLGMLDPFDQALGFTCNTVLSKRGVFRFLAFDEFVIELLDTVQVELL